MAVWSSFAFKNIGKNIDIARRVIFCVKNVPKGKAVTYVPVRSSHDRTLQIRSSTFDAYKLKDLVYFYLIIGAIPLLSIALYCNIFIGPATLALIPEGYDPKPWEYHAHPITRFLARYITPSPQELYERTLHNMFVNNELLLIKRLESRVKELIKDRGDYQAWYFDKPPVKYVRKAREFSQLSEQTSGRAGGWIV